MILSLKCPKEDCGKKSFIVGEKPGNYLHWICYHCGGHAKINALELKEFSHEILINYVKEKFSEEKK